MELKLAKEKREGELRLCMGVIVRLQHNLDEKSRDRDHLMKVLKGKQQKAQASLAPVK
jgi:peptide subunit release factor RF-3